MSTHGDEEKKMGKLVQQLAKTSLLFALIIVTEEKGKGLDTKTLLSSK